MILKDRDQRGYELSLRDQIECEIHDRGPIAVFALHGNLPLRSAQGYYSRNAEQFGKAGDFYTSSDVHAVFGRLLARQFEEMWQSLDRPPQLEILELGPGRGLFARDVLDWSRKKFPDFFAALRYTLQESSPALQAKLHETLGEHLAAGKATVLSVETRPAASSAPPSIAHPPAETPLIVFANEFFDALPVEILSAKANSTSPSKTAIWRNSGFRPPKTNWNSWIATASIPKLLAKKLGTTTSASKFPLAAQRWLAQTANAIQRGFLVVVDYGYTRSEQLAGRHRGTLMAYRQHSASANAYQAPGEQDLTAHVNFTALTAAAEQSGMRAERLITQSQFLLGIGEKTQFADAFEECRVPQERAKVALQLKHLVTPAGMGETFHVLIASRGVDPARVAALSGLSFGATHTG